MLRVSVDFNSLIGMAMSKINCQMLISFKLVDNAFVLI